MGVVYQLDADHREVLRWFEENAGAEFSACPSEVGLALRVTNPRRGIWKPASIPYAVSVVQSPKGLYEDQDPILNETDGTWEYYYHQEGRAFEDIQNPRRIYTNEALFRCKEDGVPVGVIIPSEAGSGYQVLGLALVIGFNVGFFQLVGPATLGDMTAASASEALASVTVGLVEFPSAGFDPNAEQDNRLKVIRAVHQRQGGPRFRRALLHAYEGRCAMTRYDAEPALEAAHIRPFRGPQTNHPTNGLLLRADMHDLFDLGLIAIDTSTLQIRLAKDLEGTMYEPYEGQSLWIPRDEAARPNLEALDRHWRESAVA